MKIISLARMKADQKGKITDLAGGAELRSKLMNMGIYPGRSVTKIGHLALNGPITIRCGRSVIALGHGMANKIKVEIE